MNKLARFQTASFEEINNDEQVIENNENEVVAPEPKEEIEEIRDTSIAISTEAFAGVEGLKSAIEKVPELLGKVTGFISNKFTNNKELVEGFYKPDTIRRLGGDSNYLAFSKREVFKSVGQKVKTIELVDVLKTGFETVVLPFVKIELVSAERVIAGIAANPQELRGVRYGDLISKTLESSYKKTVKDLSDCFDGKDTSSKEEFGKLYDRMADFDLSCKTISALNEDVYKININDVIGLSDRLNASFTAIVRSLENPEVRDTVSPAVVKMLSEACYQFAAQLEFYSVYLYKLRECTTAIKDTVAALKE